MYDLGDRILMVASDRISTYDVVHPTPIPDKGAVLTGLSAFWFGRTGHIVANHFVSATDDVPEDVRGRAMTVRKLEMLPVECVVRGYITGSGWKDYQATGSVSGIELPPGLRESERLPTPLFTPSTKADEGHDEAIDFDRSAELVGDRELMARVRDVSVALYRFAADHARERGVILADTKFEFGLDADGELVVGDEVLTPDSSRYWPAEGYEAGRGQPSFDKQYVRDWAAGSGWDKTPPAPALPDDVVAGTRARYVEAYELITGEPFDAWLQQDGALRARVLIRPKAGILDPQGIAVERALPALGFSGVSNVHVGRLVELDVEDAEQLDAMCRRLLANPLIEDYEIRRRQRRVKFGVIRFPGSCDDVDAQLAASRVGEAVLLWHADRDLQGVDAVIVPGGFSYGDYLRVGRDRALRACDGGGHRLRARRRAGARDLQRLPGPLRGRPAARARCCPTTTCASAAAR